VNGEVKVKSRRLWLLKEVFMGRIVDNGLPCLAAPRELKRLRGFMGDQEHEDIMIEVGERLGDVTITAGNSATYIGWLHKAKREGLHRPCRTSDRPCFILCGVLHKERTLVIVNPL
jgi:hypothetical protein